MFRISISPKPQTLNFRGAMSFQEPGIEVLHQLHDVIGDRMTLDLTEVSKWDEATVGTMCCEIQATGKQVSFITRPKDAALCLKLSLVSH
jgi:hypothetical protein